MTLLTGGGGLGKTLLAQQIATCVAAGEPVFDRATSPAIVLGLYGEDDDDELTRRQQSILRVHDIDARDVRDYHYKSLFGGETLLGHFDRQTGEFIESPLFTSIRATALDLGARLIILDNSTQMYAGDVNDRGPVVRFLQALNKLALEIGGAVLLLGHVAKSEGSTYSGSTAWRDGVRHALQITDTARPGVKMEAPDQRILKVTKANYCASGAEIHIRWESGAFVHSEIEQKVAASEKAKHDCREFLRNLDSLTGSEIALSSSRQASNYAPRRMRNECRADMAAMEQAMHSLIQTGIIADGLALPWLKSNRTPAQGLAHVKRAEQITDLTDDDEPLAPIVPRSVTTSPSVDDLMSRIAGRAVK